jgi:hypothetical protein
MSIRHCRTPILAYSMTATPREDFINRQQDPFGNHLARVLFTRGKMNKLHVSVDVTHVDGTQ